MKKQISVGRKGVIDGVNVKCVEHIPKKYDCALCAFKDKECTNAPCLSVQRNDGRHVYYEEVK